MMKIRIARQQQPALGLSHRDADVTVCMADERHEQNFFRQSMAAVHLLEAKPALARAIPVHLPRPAVQPLLRTEALPVEPGPLQQRVVALLLQHVHACPGKIIEPSGVIEIQVREHDVSDVLGLEAEALHLADGRHLLAEIRAQ